MHTQAKKRGFIFLTSMVALVVMLLVGTLFMSMASQQYQDAQRDFRSLKALAAAEAGLNNIIWKQRYSGNKVITFTLLDDLSKGTDPNFLPVTPSLDLTKDDNQLKQYMKQTGARVWLCKYMPPNSTLPAYVVFSRGVFNEGKSNQYHRVVRGVLQGATGENIRYDWLDYAIYAESKLVIENATDINGDIGSNNEIILGITNGGILDGDIHSAGSITLLKRLTDFEGTAEFGSQLFLKDGNGYEDITNNPLPYFPNTEPGAGKIALEDPIPEEYKTWAENTGDPNAFFSDTHLRDASVITQDILYANPLGTDDYALSIDCDIPLNDGETLVIFVDGDVLLNGSITLGKEGDPFTDANHNRTWDAAEKLLIDVDGDGQYDPADGDKIDDLNDDGVWQQIDEAYVDIDNNGKYSKGGAVALIATGDISCQGTPTVNGLLWASGAFGGGTPNINGSIRCDQGEFKGNNQLNFYPWEYGFFVPPDTEYEWTLVSWEMLRM